MATIRTRKQADGTTRYTAIVRLRRGKTLVHQEARTFAHRSAALTWAKHREISLEDPSALVRVQQGEPTALYLLRTDNLSDEFRAEARRAQAEMRIFLNFQERLNVEHLMEYPENPDS